MNRPNMSFQYNTDMTEIPKELDLSDEDSVFNIDNSLSTESSSVTKKDNTLLNNSNASIKKAPASAVKKKYLSLNNSRANNKPALVFGGNKQAEESYFEAKKDFYVTKNESNKRKLDGEEKASLSKNRLDVARGNVEMLKLRKQFLEDNPDMDSEEVKKLFPLTEMP